MQLFSQQVANFSQDPETYPLRLLKSINSRVNGTTLDMCRVNSGEFRKELPVEKLFIH